MWQSLQEWLPGIAGVLLGAGGIGAVLQWRLGVARLAAKYASQLQCDIDLMRARLGEIGVELAQSRSDMMAAKDEHAECLRDVAELRMEMRQLRSQYTTARIVAEENGKIVEWSPSATLLFGYEQDEVLGRGVDIITPLRHRDAHMRGFARAAGSGEVMQRPLRTEAMCADGTEVAVEITLSTYRTLHGEMRIGAEIRRR